MGQLAIVYVKLFIREPLVFLFLLECGVRLFYFTKRIPIPTHDGWKNLANSSFRGVVKGYGEITYSTSKYGFRIFGETDTDKTKILALGDSYTHAYSVSDGGTYYDYINCHNNNVEMFAYGCTGCGTVTEYLLLDEYYDIIKPDILLWQFHSSDIGSNYYKLSSAFAIGNERCEQPYLKDGEVIWLSPLRGFSWVTRLSYLAREIIIRNGVLYNIFTLEGKLFREHPLVEEAVNKTIEIMALVKKRADNTEVVAFQVDKQEWLGDAFQAICNECGIHFVPGVPEEILKAEARGVKVDGKPYDVHWNDMGHQIAGRIILNYLLDKELLD